MNIAKIITVITIQVLACNNYNLHYMHNYGPVIVICIAAIQLLPSPSPPLLFLKEQCWVQLFIRPQMLACQTSCNMVKTLPNSVAFLFFNIPSTHSFKSFCIPCRLLVGAPREKAFPAQQANRTGGLYSCDISSPNTNCMRVKFDEESKFVSAFVLNWNSCLILLVWCPFLRQCIRQLLLQIYTQLLFASE